MAPEGFFNECRVAKVPRGTKLVIYNRTSQNEKIRFEVRTARGGSPLGRITLAEREYGTGYVNNDDYVPDVRVYVSSTDNTVTVQGTFSVVRI
ncbi:hypothetical protein GCM10010394_31630 [Streptomyces crystallinus]|uniref:Uncharacterized protein n=1 Tax=Streptomyces crystallinus TaxID=68191 RepID=A0ABP3R170_9ACTN